VSATIEHIKEYELGSSVREKLNKAIDAANVINNYNFEDCPPQCPPGLPGKDGLKGDPGNYNSYNVDGFIAEGDSLPTVGSSIGETYVKDNGNTLEVYVWAPLDSGINGWKNFGPINDANNRNVPNVIYVSPDGNDDYDGRTFGKALRTLETAAIAASELSGINKEAVTVRVGAGRYEIQGDIAWPDKCSVFGLDGARKCVVYPSDDVAPDGDVPYKNRNAFLLGDGGYVEGFGFEGFEIYSSPYAPTDDDGNPLETNWNWSSNPLGGFAVAFRPGAVINRVPYAHNITVYSRFPPRNLISSPLERKKGNPLVTPGGGVAIADGSVVSPYSAFPNMMTWGATPSSPNGIGYLARKGGLLNPVNAVALWAHKHYMCQEGGQMVMSSCSSQFGDYSLWSEGYTFSIRPEKPNITLFPSIAAATIILNNSQKYTDNLWINYVDPSRGFPTCGCVCSDTEYEDFFKKDMAYALRALRFTVQTGDIRPLNQFIRGLFKWDGSFVADIPGKCENNNCNCIWQSWFKALGDMIAVDLSREDDRILVRELCRCISATIDKQEKRIERSLITAINHQWTFPLAGVTKDAVPPRFGNNGYSFAIKRSVVTKDGGRVVFSGQDDEGNAVFVGGLEIEARSGELRGPPFDAAVRKKATRVTFARSFF